MQYNVLTKGASYPYKSLSASSILPLLSLTLCFFSFCLYPPLPRAWMSVCLNESFIQVFPKKKKHLKTYQTPCHILCMDEHLYIIQTILVLQHGRNHLEENHWDTYDISPTTAKKNHIAPLFPEDNLHVHCILSVSDFQNFINFYATFWDLKLNDQRNVCILWAISWISLSKKFCKVHHTKWQDIRYVIDWRAVVSRGANNSNFVSVIAYYHRHSLIFFHYLNPDTP